MGFGQSSWSERGFASRTELARPPAFAGPVGDGRECHREFPLNVPVLLGVPADSPSDRVPASQRR